MTWLKMQVDESLSETRVSIPKKAHLHGCEVADNKLVSLHMAV